ncbi:MAG: helix-turn-helix domain containing protein [Prolixibacteraceae bacterium]|jgi:TetR/AcrR family transcriptional repressor of nem operon|nr:helix-turn-helix domain containing protein [Prolixibacteraceae bacterium]
MNKTRVYILQTSLLLFLQKSYKEVTMKEIVEKTGLSKGAFYHYFSSKEELFKEIVMLFFSMGNIDYSKFPNDSLYNFYQQYLTHTTASFIQLNELVGSNDESTLSFNFFFIMFEAMNRFPEFLAIEQEDYDQAHMAWCEIIDRAMVNGEIKTESKKEDVADLFLFSTDGSFIRFLNNKHYSGNYSDYLKTAFETIYNNIKT